jgi:hypothetical protein
MREQTLYLAQKEHSAWTSHPLRRQRETLIFHMGQSVPIKGLTMLILRLC